MSPKILRVVAFLAIGLALLGVIYFSIAPKEPTDMATVPADDPGPYLEITVDGNAKGTIRIDLNETAAPDHVGQITALATEGIYDNVVFHRVIDGFMAQTGDVEFGKQDGETPDRAGMGGSKRPNIKAEFSDIPFERGTVGMARSQDPDSANSQFFIMFAPGDFLNGKYTVVGRVVEGMEVVDAIKRGHKQTGAVTGAPDVMTSVTVSE